MARARRPKKNTAAARKDAAPIRQLRRRAGLAVKWGVRGVAALVALGFGGILVFSLANPPTTHTIWSEGRRLGSVDHQWISVDEIAPVMLRSVVAAEDANFCLHWGFDMAAIREALDEGATRGASTISQQVAKNVYLWQGRSWSRKALEALITPVIEATWSKRRILEVYLNVAEFGEGIFGVDAAAHRYFRVPPSELTAVQAARLAVLLPNPKARDPRSLTPALQRRAARVADGAETIRRDGRAACFES